MPWFRKAWHSEQSDGFKDSSGDERAVFHVCLNCHYLQTIMANGNAKRRKGKDGEGNPRELCVDCATFIHLDECCDEIYRRT